jgi:NTP pyrophosphatase (non-canonical NTP hydrolase)
LEIREEVKWFSEQMENKLKANDDKGGWSNCDLFWLVDRLKEEVDELENSLYNYRSLIGTKLEIIEEASDVGNFAMMIADIARKRLQQ